MGGYQVEGQGPNDDGFDEEGYDESQRAEILEATRDGPTDGAILTDLTPDLGEDPDEGGADELDELDDEDAPLNRTGLTRRLVQISMAATVTERAAMPDKLSTDPRVDAYIARQADFAKPILAWFRERVHAACPDVEETIKWGMPFFTYRSRPFANMAAFKAHAAFGLWDRDATATGKEGEAMGQRGRIESVDDLPPAAEVEAQIREGAALVDAGHKPARSVRTPKGEAEVPPELAEALARDDLAAATFNNFPPSCRREYCEWVGEAKRPETRDKRIAETVAWLREGKRRNWKYENC